MKTMKPKISNCKCKASFVDTSRGLRSVGVNAYFLKPCPLALFTCFQKFCLVFLHFKVKMNTGKYRRHQEMLSLFNKRHNAAQVPPCEHN